MTESISAVVCDAGSIIHLDELNQLSLFRDFSTIFVTQTVKQEVEKHRSIDLSQLSTEIIPEPVVDSQLSTWATTFCLHAGEQSALSYACTKKNVIFLTDDAAARFVAGQMKLRVYGTIGVLLRAVRRGLKSSNEIKSCLESIPHRSTLHIRANLLNQVIEELEKYHN
ncbi:DUF3368 domain-containing protein [Candidatus Parabeggiatoa sp. HSG14]|uniref:DUF3368 domain-containing protein n=1 Tax=Candidatus Parabeggiatoa sp. HSG14 TaxID=3055593 RepID=UPI0025A6A462|nr:DUF3368 domain-containing protein [Thiotrichales bacterium HSG14]